MVPEILKHLPLICSERFHDVFVGGGSVSIAVAQQFPDAKIFMNDLDATVSSFWMLIASGKVRNLCKQISACTPSVQEFNRLRRMIPKTMEDRAFHAVFFNRTTFSGIAKASPIGGQRQMSKWKIGCRFNAEAIANSILKLTELFQGRLTVSNLDAVEYMRKNKSGGFYLDPPYFKKGKELYSQFMSGLEHVRLRDFLEKRDNFLLSYDACEEIRELYADLQSFRQCPDTQFQGRKKHGNKAQNF